MSYTEKISNIKKQKNKDVITTQFSDHEISLKVIDDSPETVSLSTKWRRNNLKWFQSTFTNQIIIPSFSHLSILIF